MNTCIDQPASGLLYGYMAYYLQSTVRGVGGQEYKGGGGCTKLPLHNAVCARFRYLYILSFPLLAFCTKMCYSRFKGDAVCACYYAGWCECIAHSKMAVGCLYRQPRCCCMTRLSWRKPFCCAHPPPPPHPPLTLPSPCTPSLLRSCWIITLPTVKASLPQVTWRLSGRDNHMVMRVGEREAKASNTSAHDAHT